MATLFYHKHNASMSLKKSGFKVSQILTKNAEWQFFDKNRPEGLLITSSDKALIVFSPLFLIIIMPEVLESNKI